MVDGQGLCQREIIKKTELGGVSQYTRPKAIMSEDGGKKIKALCAMYSVHQQSKISFESIVSMGGLLTVLSLGAESQDFQ